MLKLRSGMPGTGKTNSVFNELMDGVKFPNSDEFRPIYYYGVVLLPEDSPILSSWIKLQNPKMWHEEVSDGSIVYIDECQEHFPTRTRGDVPAGVVALERHRHRGIDLYFTTQHPMKVDVEVRRVVGEHQHFKRNFGASFSVCYLANEVMDDPQDYHRLSTAAKSNYFYNKKAFELYRSTVVDTYKFKMPRMLWFGLACLLFLGFMIYKLVGIFNKPKNTAAVPVSAAVSANHALTPQEEYLKRSELKLESFAPVINNVPASSPAYQALWKPKSAPIVSSCIGSADRCRCYSQQGTVLSVSIEYCRYVLANGSNYDHTLPDNRVPNNVSFNNR